MQEWSVPTHDWEPYPEGVFGLEISFHFPGTWEPVFDGIRTELTNLVDFRMENTGWQFGPYFNSAENMGCGLTCLRYATFNSSLYAKPWKVPEACGTGEMEFGNNNPMVVPPEERRSVEELEEELEEVEERDQQVCLNRAKETLAGDTRAFEDLVNAVKDRRRERGLLEITF